MTAGLWFVVAEGRDGAGYPGCVTGVSMVKTDCLRPKFNTKSQVGAVLKGAAEVRQMAEHAPDFLCDVLPYFREVP